MVATNYWRAEGMRFLAAILICIPAFILMQHWGMPFWARLVVGFLFEISRMAMEEK